MSARIRIMLLMAATLSIATVHAQRSTSPIPYYSYCYDYKLSNPAFTGTLARHTITAAYSGESHGRMDYFYGSYERNIESAKTSLGGIALYDEFGAQKNYYLGTFINRRIKFNERSGLYVGTQLFFKRDEMDYLYYDIDQGDPVLVEVSARQRNVSFDLGTVYYINQFSVGASVKNILDTRLDETSVSVIAQYQADLSDNFKMNPSIHLVFDRYYTASHLNTTFQIHRWILLGAGVRVTSEGGFDSSINGGVNISGRLELITHWFSSSNYELRQHKQARIESMLRIRLPNPRKVGE